LLGTVVAEGTEVEADGMEAVGGMEAVADGMEAVGGMEAKGGTEAVGMEGDGTAVVGMVVVGVAVGTGVVGDPAMVGVVTIRTIRTRPGVIIRKDPRIT
jgi:hypothetical protein